VASGVVWPLRRTVHAAAAVNLGKKSIFDLSVNSVQPLLGPNGCRVQLPILRSALQPHVIDAKASKPFRVSAIIFSDARGSMKQLQDRISCLVELIDMVSLRIGSNWITESVS